MSKVVLEKDRVATPPQSSASTQSSDKVASMEVVETSTPVPITIVLTESGDEANMERIKVYRMDPRMIAKTLQSCHNKFWSDMGLNVFSSLEWKSTVGSTKECRQFVANSIAVGRTNERWQMGIAKVQWAKGQEWVQAGSMY
ncbi:unnamed protein product [Calypogeia fissa]